MGLTISREAHPAHDHQGPCREAAAGLRRRQNVRDWLYVEDHARALVLVARARHASAETYNIGGRKNEQTSMW